MFLKFIKIKDYFQVQKLEISIFEIMGDPVTQEYLFFNHIKIY